MKSSSLRRSRLAPRCAKAVAVAEPENGSDEKEHDLVERTGDRRDAEGGERTQPAREAAVPQDDPDGTGGTPE